MLNFNIKSVHWFIRYILKTQQTNTVKIVIAFSTLEAMKELMEKNNVWNIRPDGGARGKTMWTVWSQINFSDEN